MRDWGNRISGFCAQEKHQRCDGWMVIPDESAAGRHLERDQSVRCECSVCDHPRVEKYRHLIEGTYGGIHR